VHLATTDGRQVLAALVGTTAKSNPFASFRTGWREIGGSIARKLNTSKDIVVDLGITETVDLVELVEGLLLGSHDAHNFKSDKSGFALKQITVVSSLSLPKGVIARAEILAEAVHATRDLTNLPANHLHPADLAKVAQKSAAKVEGVTVKVYDEKQLDSEGFGGISAVGAGAEHPPRLVHLSYRPRGAKKHLALVGKGITFDTGGNNLKTGSHMFGMNNDMAGSAVVLALCLLAAEEKWPVQITGYMAITENILSGKAYRPNDVVTSLKGKTIEVIDTDAEGRLVLADTLTLASQEKPDLVIDFATLTGSVIRA
jgi:leucyl aminopeptidase